MYKLNIIFEGM